MLAMCISQSMHSVQAQLAFKNSPAVERFCDLFVWPVFGGEVELAEEYRVHIQVLSTTTEIKYRVPSLLREWQVGSRRVDGWERASPQPHGSAGKS